MGIEKLKERFKEKREEGESFFTERERCRNLTTEEVVVLKEKTRLSIEKDLKIMRPVDIYECYKDDPIFNEVYGEMFPTKEIEIPKIDRLVSNFAKECADVLGDRSTLFFKKDIEEVVEIKDNEDSVGSKVVKPHRLVTMLERYIIPVKKREYDGVEVTKPKSINADLAKILLKSQILHDGLRPISRIFTTSLPIIHDGELTFPKRGYDERFCSWMPKSAPDITDPDMKIEDAKDLLKNLLKEFCFKTDQDRYNALSFLITPALRGLYSKNTNKSPVYFLLGNREGVGKDYLAGVVGIVYEGKYIEDAPVSCGIGSINNLEELRKKLVSLLISGRKRIHSANNKGNINNAVWENFTSSPTWSSRLLGGNEMATADNEVDVSMSGNTGITMSSDLRSRSIGIHLFYSEEDINNRKFDKPDLHGWVLENREKILSAIYSLIKNWFDNGCPEPKGKHRFPEWMRVCGGIMESVGWKIPISTIDDEVIDSGTEDMRLLFEIIYENKPEEKLKLQNIISFLNEENEDRERLFTYLDLTQRNDKTKFGKKFHKFAGRQLAGIYMKVVDPTQRSLRREYIFTKSLDKKSEESEDPQQKIGDESKEDIEKEEPKEIPTPEVGQVGQDGQVYTPYIKKDKNNNKSREPIPPSPPIQKESPTPNIKDLDEHNNLIYNVIAGADDNGYSIEDIEKQFKKMMNKEELYKRIERMKSHYGIIWECSPGRLRKV